MHFNEGLPFEVVHYTHHQGETEIEADVDVEEAGNVFQFGNSVADRLQQHHVVVSDPINPMRTSLDSTS